MKHDERILGLSSRRVFQIDGALKESLKQQRNGCITVDSQKQANVTPVTIET